MDNAIHQINLYPTDSANAFFNTDPLDSDLSGGWCYLVFEQPEPGNFVTKKEIATLYRHLNTWKERKGEKELLDGMVT